MEQSKGFTVEPFRPRVRDGYRSDKGKHHNYPKQRKKWNPRICLRHSRTNLGLNDSNTQHEVMEPKHKFKGTPAMRAYWREQKRKQRQKKEKKECS